MKKLAVILTVFACMVASAAYAVTTTTSYSVTITITPAVTSINLSNTSLITIGPSNANSVVGDVSVTSNPPGGTFTGALVLGGADAAKFTLTNGGVIPCSLVVGPVDIPAGTYAITLSATQ